MSGYYNYSREFSHGQVRLFYHSAALTTGVTVSLYPLTRSAAVEVQVLGLGLNVWVSLKRVRWGRHANVS